MTAHTPAWILDFRSKLSGAPIPRPKIHKHRLPRDCEIRAKDILGGLYHEYWLEQRVA
jgi:hypothetical protein